VMNTAQSGKETKRVVTLDELVARATELKEHINILETTINVHLNQYREVQLAFDTLKGLPEAPVQGYMILDRLSSVMLPVSVLEGWPSNVLVNLGLGYYLKTNRDKAVEILQKARELGEKVVVHGDYDVDGITGTAVLYTFLSENGWLVDYYIPKRLDNGYGVQPQFVEEAANNGVRIILTVDCGITAFEAAKRARELGIKMVITDHHEPKEALPEADAIVNPKRVDDTYPFKGFAGVGVAYKLISALAEKLNLPPSLVDELLDVVALGTVADMVELLDENRYIVKEGLKKLNTKAKLGIIKLLQKLGIGVV